MTPMTPAAPAIPMPKTSLSPFGRFLLLIAGLGGLLYGVDIGIFAPALLYLEKTVNLSIAQNSAIAAAVFLGSMLGSPLTGALADRLGRRPVMVLAGALFSGSVGLIVLSQSFATLFTGRLLQGLSGGVIAVVVPLYLAEALPADRRGRATAIFQFMLTFGIVVASAIGFLYTQHAERTIAAAGTDTALIQAAANHAWRGMFLAILYPGLLFFAGSLALVESPRWLVLRGRRDEAAAALLRIGDSASAQTELETMTAPPAILPDTPAHPAKGTLLQRRYVVPFLLACVVLACNQTTGINSVLTFLVIILKQAGLNPTHATQGDLAVKLLNCVMTLVAVALVDRKGRTFLLKLGTTGIVISLLAAAVLFYRFESKRSSVTAAVTQAVQGNTLHIHAGKLLQSTEGPAVQQLTVIYNYGDGDHIANAIASGDDSLALAPDPKHPQAPLAIVKAYEAPVPSSATGWLIAGCVAFFIASFAVGPGVVVWLALSELMPLRIRSTGMGIALLINQGVSTAIAALFLPAVGRFGYYSMFFFWAACTVVYFITAAFFLPETKGRTLEEIELSFR